MTGTRRKRSYSRGYPMAVLIGFEENRAVLWQVFSKVVKPYATIELQGRRNNEKAVYSFHESIVDKLRPILREGIKSVVVTTPAKTDYAQDFLSHVQKHHAWLTREGGSNALSFGELAGSASQASEVADLVRTKRFHELISETISTETDHIVDALEKRLNDINGGSALLYSLEEIEELIYKQWKEGDSHPEYIVLTDRYLTNRGEKDRIQRLLQIARNKNIKTRVVGAGTAAGKRINQFGGLVCFTKEDSK